MNKTLQALSALLSLAAVLACSDGGSTVRETPREDPIRQDVPAVRNTHLKIIVTSNLTYSAKDESGARGTLPELVLQRLNEKGRADGNTFSIASGEQQNLTLHYTINNDGNNRFTGSVNIGAWYGYNWTEYSGQYSYADGWQMVEALTDKVSNWLHTGWVDPRKNK